MILLCIELVNGQNNDKGDSFLEIIFCLSKTSKQLDEIITDLIQPLLTCKFDDYKLSRLSK